MKDNPYLSQRTRDAAMRGIEDLSTDVLLNAMRQMPLSDYRRKELDEAYQKDVSEHKKVFRMEEKAPREIKPVNPAQLLAGMAYAKAPAGPSGGDTSGGLRVRPSQAKPEQGDPLGAYKVKTPDLPDAELRTYEGFKIDGSAGDGSAQSEVG